MKTTEEQDVFDDRLTILDRFASTFLFGIVGFLTGLLAVSVIDSAPGVDLFGYYLLTGMILSGLFSLAGFLSPNKASDNIIKLWSLLSRIGGVISYMLKNFLRR